MKEPSQYEKLHWAIVNAGAKLFAYGLVLVCALFILLVFAAMFGWQLGAEYPAWILMLLVPLLIVGVLMIKAKSCYPAECKEWYESK